MAYEEMADSSVFHRYVECSRHLQRFDLRLLRSREERMAFWINLFNVMVIHGGMERILGGRKRNGCYSLHRTCIAMRSGSTWSGMQVGSG